MRAGPNSQQSQRAALIHGPFATIAARVEVFQHELLNQPLGAYEMERLTQLQSRLSLLIYLEDSLRTLHSTVESLTRVGPLADLVSTFVEGLDFVLLTGIDALETKSPENVDMLMQITRIAGILSSASATTFWPRARPALRIEPCCFR
jgi:hypothetical protein